MSSFILDVQSGVVVGPSIGTVELSAQDLGLIYWASLGAPDMRIATALRLTDTSLPGLLQDVAQRLGLDALPPKTAIARADFQMVQGVWPQSSTPWSERHAGSILQDGLCADAIADRPFAIVSGEGVLSLHDVADMVARIRSGLAHNGVGRGSFVALDATQCFETMVLSCATLLQGAAIVRLSENMQDAMLQDNLRASPSQMTFTAQTHALAGMPEAGFVIDLRNEGSGAADFMDWLDHCTCEDLPDADITPTDIALVGFTSGTTGRPKKILNTHEALFRSSEVGLRLNKLGENDIFCSATDIVSMGSFRNMVTWPLMCGGQILFLSNDGRRSPLTQALECKSHGVTFLTAVPNVIRGFIQAADRIGPLPELRTIIVESGILDAASKASFTYLFDAAVTDIYGKREINHVLRSDPNASTPIGVSGGSPMEILARVLDANGAPVRRKDSGEVFIMTDCMAQDTDDLVIGEAGGDHKGWHATGDLGSVTDDGQFRVTARLTDVIKSPDGEILVPQEVETALMLHPAVREACVFSVVGKDGIERVGASVIAATKRDDPSKDDSLEWALRQHVLSRVGNFKTPDNILILDTFPRLARDKPDQKELRASYLSVYDQN